MRYVQERRLAQPNQFLLQTPTPGTVDYQLCCWKRAGVYGVSGGIGMIRQRPTPEQAQAMRVTLLTYIKENPLCAAVEMIRATPLKRKQVYYLLEKFLRHGYVTRKKEQPYLIPYRISKLGQKYLLAGCSDDFIEAQPAQPAQPGQRFPKLWDVPPSRTKAASPAGVEA